ncbi:hypothetical protein HAX54_004222 [Datura stramonium]|uniref:Uncharacterized protein n=1 Tax=Datura stramonium TaxID=4076 RepID=A0ABS8WWT3_DATST|nr:hypothetical protein [Datura stramonium]
MSLSSQRAKGNTLMVFEASHEPDLDEEWKIAQLYFGLAGLEAYYLSFRSLFPKIGKRILCLLSGSIGHLEYTGRVDEMRLFSFIMLVKLAKVIPSMIHHAIKAVMKPVVDKLGNLCAWVDILESDVAALRKEMEIWNAMVPPMGVDLNHRQKLLNHKEWRGVPPMIGVLGLV